MTVNRDQRKPNTFRIPAEMLDRRADYEALLKEHPELRTFVAWAPPVGAEEVAEMLQLLLSGTTPAADPDEVSAVIQIAASEVVDVPFATMRDAVEQLRVISERESDPALTTEARATARQLHQDLKGRMPAESLQERPALLAWRDAQERGA